MSKQINELRDEASRCRQEADADLNVEAVSQLLSRAFELDSQAAELEARLRAPSLN